MENELTIETLRVKHALLDAAIKEEETHIWKNLSKIEQLKREKLKQKDEILRMTLQDISN
ncbi:MAG: YdcH family protein [Alphaproteobacteria bacterium]|nr:YdcH family protein [Alphaproteobacteria bacterium]